MFVPPRVLEGPLIYLVLCNTDGRQRSDPCHRQVEALVLGGNPINKTLSRERTGELYRKSITISKY